MSRVFRMEDWAPGAQFSTSPSQPISRHSDEAKKSQSTFTFRKRLRSLPLGNDSDVADQFQNLSINDNIIPEKETRDGKLRGLFRRASMSMRGKRTRRHSQVPEERPSTGTTWHKLRQATSFNRHARFLSGQGYTFEAAGPVDSCRELGPLRPGNGAAPPVIPHGSAGAAARRQAAAQNEYFGRHRQVLRTDDGLGEDRESGIGIPLTTNEPATYANTSDSSISRVVGVDFIMALPAELAIQILSLLDHKELAKVARISRGWARVCRTPQIWRDSFLREKSKTYAMGRPVSPGKGLGIPNARLDKDWKDLYRIRDQLEHNWREGEAAPIYLNGHLDSIYCVQFDESKIITGSRDKTIRVWNMRDYTCKLVIGPPDVVRSPSIMTGDDGKSQHYATMPNQSRVAESTPRCVSHEIHHDKSILCLQYDDQIMVTGSSDGTCIVYDVKNDYTPTMRLRHHTAAVLDLSFDDRYIVTCSKDASICIWDRPTGAMLKQLRGHSGPVNAVQMRGNTIVSCSGDFRVKLWNLDTGKNIREFSGHTKGLACSQFSEDSKFIASAGNDKIIRIWDANTGDCLQKIGAHDNLVRSLHIDSVSGRMVSGSYDQDIKVFDMETGRLLLDFPKWHQSWVLGAKSDYRRIISIGQEPKILIMDFGMDVKGIEKLES